MTGPYPSHAALLGDTDLHIKTLAYATDAKLAGYLSMFVATGSPTTDINGDIVVDFHTAKTIIGCQAKCKGFTVAQGPVKQTPPEQGSQVSISANAVTLIPRQYLANGLVWVKCVTSPTLTSNGKFYGSQPVASGVTIPYFAFGWAL